MVLSPADFDAYSRATGRPVPEDQEERGRLVPEVREYRSNQLKLPETKQQQGSGLLEALGIGAALLGGGALLAGALGRKGGVRMGNAQQAAKEAVQNVNVRDVSDVYRAAGRPAPSKPAPTAAPSPQPSPTPRPAGSRQGGVSLADLSRLSGTEPKGLLRGRQPGGAITQFAPRGELTDLSITEVPVVDITTQVQTPKPSSGKDFIAGYFKQSATPAGYLTEAEVAPINDRADELLQERELNRQRDIARRIRAQDATIIGKGERLLDQLLSESRAGQQPVVAVEQVVPESLVAKQQTIGARVADQTANAIDAAEDQMTGRIKSQLQRNEDLDLSQIEVLEEMTEQNRQWMMEQDEPINQVASQLPDGLPVDQAEQNAGAFAKKQLMQTRMQQARQQLAQEGYKGLALEKELAKRTNIKQASELYAATGDPSVLSLASETPSLPLTITPKTSAQLGSSNTSFINEEIPTSSYYEPWKEREAESGGLVYADIYHTNQISNITAKLEGTPEFIDNPEYVNFIEQTNMAMNAMRQGDQMARKIFIINRDLLRNNQAPAPKLANPEHKTLLNQLNYAQQAREDVRNRQSALALQAERFPQIQKVVQTGEGTRVFGEVDPETKEIIPETMEVRAGRPSLPAGTASETATGRAIRGRVGAEGTVAGPYPGIRESGAIQTESTLRPESLRYRGEAGRAAYEAADEGKGLEYQAVPIRWDPNIHTPEQRTPEGFVYSEEAMMRPSDAPSPRYRSQPLVSEEAALDSVALSAELRRLQQQGRPGEAQAFLNNVMQQRGISSLGRSQPLQPFRQITKKNATINSNSQYDLPMNFAYRGQSIPNTPTTTFEAIQAGLRTSTLRQPGQIPAHVTPGSTITAVGPQGQRQLLQVTGRRMVTPDMAQELSEVERWTPEFLTNYINKRGGKMEQITYKMI